MSLAVQAQFPGAAGTQNSTAIHKDSTLFIAWSNQCTIERGWLNAANQSLGKASLGTAMSATGKPGENGILSLGDGGIAIVQFEQPIKNGPGADFAIFENSFSDFFLELAFVEVSSDSVSWVRFPATCNLSQDTQIGPFDEKSDPTKLNNLAGKYRAQYGTPFDLEELKDSMRLDMDSIVYVRIIDAVGSLNPSVGTKDKNGNWVNDPFPTPFPSSGFDLDAVGVIHQNVVGIKRPKRDLSFIVYPNPARQNTPINFKGIDEQTEILIYTTDGKLIAQGVKAKVQNLHLVIGLYTLLANGKTCKLSVVD
jgi:hypothetical protein